MRSKASSTRSSNGGSLSAVGRFDDEGLPKDVDACELPGNELQMNIMQECMGLAFFFWIHYTRFWFWRYRFDRQTRKFTYRGSDNGRGTADDTHGRVFKHDSILVKIASGKWIKAEKGGDTGIRVFVVKKSEDPEKWEDPGDKGPGRYKVRFTTGVFKLGKGKEEWTVGELRQRLRSCDDPDYNIVSANCWKYAYSCAKAVLEWVKENAEDEQVKDRVQEKLMELARLERPMPLEILRAIWNPFTEKSQQVLKHFEEILSDTLKALPKKSFFRTCGVWMILGFSSLLAWINARTGAAYASLVHSLLLLVMVVVLLVIVVVPLVMVVVWLVMVVVWLVIVVVRLVKVVVLIFKDRFVAVGKLVIECYRIVRRKSQEKFRKIVAKL